MFLIHVNKVEKKCDFFLQLTLVDNLMMIKITFKQITTKLTLEILLPAYQHYYVT